MTSEYRCFKVRREGEVGILRLANPHLYGTDDYADLQTELMQVGREMRPRLLVVDLGEVSYCSTAVVNGLLQLRKELVKHGGELKLAGLSPEVREVFHCLRLENTIFKIYESTAAAIAAG
jgi:anti-anti-sigma factor